MSRHTAQRKIRKRCRFVLSLKATRRRDKLAKSRSNVGRRVHGRSKSKESAARESERRKVYAALQYAPSFHCPVEKCEEL